MQITGFRQSWQKLQGENTFHRILTLIMLLVTLISTYGWLHKERVVVLVPPGISDEMTISDRKASGTYKVGWGVFLAHMVGNVTPESSKIVQDMVNRYLSGDARLVLARQIAENLDRLRQDKVSAVFELRKAFYDPNDDLVFVNGMSSFVGQAGKTRKVEHTFEFRVTIANWGPEVTSMALVEGPPIMGKNRQKAKSKEVNHETH
ncbi:MAG: hypothetical protein G8345_00675 [Magnetococcales bacterium]|nr:hypothetical protein [Magnetococcales bacterium]NGZ25382.1 hypothetical protein [Magnetococcales bacterium]